MAQVMAETKIDKNESLTHARKNFLRELCARYQLDIVYAFGSRAAEAYEWLMGQRDTLAPSTSDLDIGLWTHNGKPLVVNETVELMLLFEDWFNVPRVDLVYLPSPDAFLDANIIRGEQLYARAPLLAAERELYLLRRAGDLAPFKRQRMELILQGTR
jgi:hypothetical protein